MPGTVDMVTKRARGYFGLTQVVLLGKTQLLLLGKFEYTGGPIFKVVLEC